MARAKEIRSIGNADLQHIRNMTASTHTLRKGFLTLFKGVAESLRLMCIYLHMCVPSSKKHPTTSLLKYLLRITETFVELVRLFKQLYFLFSCSRTRLSPFTPRGASGCSVWGRVTQPAAASCNNQVQTRSRLQAFNSQDE